MWVVAVLAVPATARAAGPAWLAPEDHDQPTGLEKVYDEKIGVNAVGDAAAVWQSGPPDGSSETLLASIRPAGGVWSPAQEISFPADTNDGINVDVDNAGDVLVTWYPFDGASQINSPIYYRYHPAGGSWGNITLLTGGDSSAPFAAFDGGVTATLAYRDFSGAMPVVRWLTIAAGTTVSAAQTFSLPAVPTGFSNWTNQCAPFVAANRSGAAVVVWSAQLDSARWVVLGAIRPAAGRPFGAPQILPLDGVATENGQDAMDPEAAIASDGRIVVTWITGGEACDFSTAGDQGNMNVDSATYNPLTGLWTKRGPILPAPVYRIPRWHVDDNRGWHRVLGVDDAGNATLVWLQEPNPPAQVCNGVDLHSPDGVVAAAALPASIGEWGSLRTDLGSNQDIAVEDKDCFPLGVELSMNAAGDAAATWLEDVSPTQRREVARVKPRGSDWAARQSVSGVVTNQLDSPGLVMDSFGDAVTDYRLGPESENGVLQTAAFDGSGPQLRNVRLPQLATMLDPLTFSVNPFDVFSSPGTPTWTFGDGSSATGTLVTHTYADGGTYTVTVMAADSLGNVTQIPYQLSVTSLPPPAATAGSASALTQTTAVLAGTVNGNGLATSYRFDWGTTTAYGQATAAVSLQASKSDAPVQATLTGLAPSTLYHYRIAATSSKGTTVTDDHTFRTLAPLPPRDLRLSKVAFHVSWHQSRAFGTIRVAGSAQAAGVVRRPAAARGPHAPAAAVRGSGRGVQPAVQGAADARAGPLRARRRRQRLGSDPVRDAGVPAGRGARTSARGRRRPRVDHDEQGRSAGRARAGTQAVAVGVLPPRGAPSPRQQDRGAVVRAAPPRPAGLEALAERDARLVQHPQRQRAAGQRRVPLRAARPLEDRQAGRHPDHVARASLIDAGVGDPV